MPETYRIRITPRGLADLESIFEYIRRDSPQNAAKMTRVLLDAIDSLNLLPHRYDVPRSGNIQGRQIRSMPVRPYLVRYRIDERSKTVYILRVRHGAQRRPCPLRRWRQEVTWSSIVQPRLTSNQYNEKGHRHGEQLPQASQRRLARPCRQGQPRRRAVH